MNARCLLDRFGTWALVKVFVALLVFLALHLIRLPLLVLARVLELGMTGMDRLITAGVTEGHITGLRREPLRPNGWR